MTTDRSRRTEALLYPAAAALLLAAVCAGRLTVVAGTGEADLATGARLLQAGLVLDAVLLWFTFRLRTEGFGETGSKIRIAAPEAVSLAFITAIGAVLRLVHLDTGLWLDEIATVVNYLRLPPLRLFSTYTSANQHLLYSVLGSISIDSLGESAWAARLPAVVYGVGGIVAIWWFGRTVATPIEALLAAALLSLSYHHIWFSQNARGYTGMLFWCLLGSTFFVRATLGGALRDWSGFVFSFTLGIGTLQNSMFVFGGAVLSYLVLLLLRDDRSATRTRLVPVVVAATWVVLLAVEIHALAFPQMVRFFSTVDRSGLGSMSVRDFAHVLMPGLRNAAPLLALLGGGAVAVAGSVSYWRRDRLTALLMIVPAPLNALALIALRYGAYPRSFLYVLPTALLLAIRGSFVAGEIAGRVHPRLRLVVPALLCTSLLVAFAASLPRLYRYPKQDYRGALRYVQMHKAPGDAVAAVGLAAVAYRLYYGPEVAVPGSAAELNQLRHAVPTLWVLYSFRGNMKQQRPSELSVLDREFERVAVFRGTVGDGDVHVMRSRRTTAGPMVEYSR